MGVSDWIEFIATMCVQYRNNKTDTCEDIAELFLKCGTQK
jgi:hypothetical protein